MASQLGEFKEWGTGVQKQVYSLSGIGQDVRKDMGLQSDFNEISITNITTNHLNSVPSKQFPLACVPFHSLWPTTLHNGSHLES